MKPGNLSDRRSDDIPVIRCQFPRDEIQPKNPVLGEACHADAVHAKPRFFLCMTTMRKYDKRGDIPFPNHPFEMLRRVEKKGTKK